MMIIDPATDIMLIAIIMSLVSQLLRRKFVNEKEMKAYQKQMKERQNRMKELMHKEDSKSRNELEALQKEMMDGMSTMMQGSIKMMMISMAIFIPLFFLVGLFYSGAEITLPFPIPWLGTDQFIELYHTTSWLGWYVLNSLIFGILFNVAMKGLEKVRSGNAVSA